MYPISKLIPQLSKIDKDLLNLLSMFVFNHYLSIYQIHRKIKEKGIRISYKNVHKKVQKLIDFKLIELEIDRSKFQERELERGAKFYKLSEEGIFVLFYDSSILDNMTIYYFDQAINQQKKDKDVKCVSKIFMEYKKEIFKCHSNCEFFELFINPWISIDKLVNLNNDFIDKIRIYLTTCCHIVKDQILATPKGIFNIYQDLKKDIMVSENGTETNDFDLDTLGEGIKNVNDHCFLSFINKRYSFNLETVRVKRVNNNQTIVISKLDDRKQIQFLYSEEEEEKKLDMILIDGDDISKVSFPVDTNKKFKLQSSIYLQNQIECFSLLYLKAAISIAIENLQDDDLELLKTDKKFMKTLSEANNRFNFNFNILNK